MAYALALAAGRETRLPMKTRMKVLVAVRAVNMLTATPMNSVKANPCTIAAPNVVPNQYSMAHVMNVDMLLSLIEGQARLNPFSTAA